MDIKQYIPGIFCWQSALCSVVAIVDILLGNHTTVVLFSVGAFVLAGIGLAFDNRFGNI